ncbi:AAA family ATPase (plasmid) [Haladaptatus sp. SPP-AMP-3]|uniref:Cdc6/Cdc18 family protein n=1 Tax=Haladaptatus sp. SPP-AMP-3 TaxID=3121295 RepID=UPI003C2D43E6
MGLGHLSADDPIFLDEDVFRDSYTPEEMVARDEELNEYLQTFKPIVRGKRPRNVFLYGKTGVGKTKGTELVMDRLIEDANDLSVNGDEISVRVITLECKQLNTSYQVAANLINKFRTEANRFPTTGVPAGDVYNTLYRHLRELDATHCVIVLDEIDSIGSDDEILYSLPRCNDNGNVPPEKTKIGVVGICNSFSFKRGLSARVQDSLCDEEILFPPYDANDLRKILYQRATKGIVGVEYHDEAGVTDYGVLGDDVIPLIAALVAQESGSARDALSLMYLSGKSCRERDGDTISEQDVREARQREEQGRTADEIRQLPIQGKLTMMAVMKLEDAGYPPLRSKDIYKAYSLVAEAADTDTLSLRSFRRRVSDLLVRDFLAYKESNEGKSGGSYRKYELGGIDDNVAREVVTQNEDGESGRLADIASRSFVQKFRRALGEP